MPDLTLERIAELRACQDKVRSFHGTHDLGGLAAAMHEWSRQLQMSSEALLDAAERGLTGGWVKNGPDVEKPEGINILLWRGDVGAAVVGEWSRLHGEWVTDDKDSFGKYDSRADDDVTYFMELKEPTDG